MQSSSVLLTRCWEKGLQCLLHIITKCDNLGTERKFWGTHELQPGRGNLSQFHLTLDCTETREELVYTMESKLQRFNAENRDFAVAYPRLLENNDDDVQPLYHRMVHMLTHDCKKGQTFCK